MRQPECWQDLRSRSKLKQSKINAERRKTGGGSESQIKLSQTEEATLNLISPVCIDGHMEVQESVVEIQPETELHIVRIGGYDYVSAFQKNYKVTRSRQPQW
ncbi:uncharacterized protein LOC114254334 isoform X2 [Monomorium pharaonis]|uniref:uncharacterized protein LOC114254334 isoform X2 n=1 Tax=Monomorium pharaonis TaxID=307658 RepID=UPI001745D738|nr:uncharacterized protein LOC114254334 isoform X2 [Monomorium pharaonis]